LKVEGKCTENVSRPARACVWERIHACTLHFFFCALYEHSIPLSEFNFWQENERLEMDCTCQSGAMCCKYSGGGGE
jgi:hypothetical protein